MHERTTAPQAGAAMKRVAVIVLFAAVAAIGLAYAATVAGGRAPRSGTWVLLIAVPLAMIAVTALGAARSASAAGGLGKLAVPFAAVLLILLGAFAAAVLLPAAAEPLLLGLPRRAAIVLYGVGVLPALILPIAYALTFDDFTLTEEDVERVREAARQEATGTRD
jgi:hypothetical protein